MGHGANDGYSRQNPPAFITRAQLHALGFSDHAIAHRVRRGSLIRVYRGVYAIGHLPTQPLDRAHAALLAVGERSALSHASAASYWGIYRDWREPFEVSTPLDRRPTGIKIHHCVTLSRADVHHDGIRVTSAARTALDLTPRMTEKRLTRMVNDLRVRRCLQLADLRSLLKRNPTHPGASRLKAVVLGSQREPTRSQLEEVFLKIVRRAGLPAPLLNQHVCGYRVDFQWPGLIVEVDGYNAHSDPAQFAKDRRQDREILIRTGTRTIRFTYDDCVDTPAAVAETLTRAV